MSRQLHISRDEATDRGHRAPDLGPRLGRYELYGLIGVGGMGMVFEAFDPVLARAIAIKVLRDTGAGQREQAARLLREAKTLARLAHPNVIRVYDAGDDDERTFLAMELVRGCTLAEWVGRAPRSAHDVIGMYVQAGRGLAAAHDAGLVHRDFKPQNVLVGNDGRVLVSDFGLARPVTHDESMTPSRPLGDGPLISTPGEVVGTPAFMAPEQRTGGPVDGRTDQYSFCLALWRDLTAPPTAGPTETTIVARAPSMLPLVGAERIPASIRSALQRGLETSPERRFPSMHALLAVLERAAPREERLPTTEGVRATRSANLAGTGARLRRHLAAAPARAPRRARSLCSAATHPGRRRRPS